MWRELVRNALLMSLLGAFLSGAALPAQAAAIHDDGGFFSRPALDKANARLADLEKEFGKQVRIDTFKTVPDGRGDEVAKMKPADRARYFENWIRDRASKEHVKGIYVLISKHPGHIEVAADRQSQNQGIGAKERTQLRDKLMAGFRHEKYDQSLADAVDYLGGMLKEKLHAKSVVPARSKDGHQGVHHQAPAGRQGMGWLGWVIVIGAVLLGIRLLGAMFGGGSGYPMGGGYGPGLGGGGFFGSLMTGMLGAVAGNWLYHNMFGGSDAFGHSGGIGAGDDAHTSTDTGAGEDFQTTGGDYDGGAESGGDFGGGDFGGGDFGGGDFGGGDF